MKKLTEDQIRQLPELRKTRTALDIAKEWGVSKTIIFYWQKKFRDKGVVCGGRRRSAIENIVA